MIRRILGGGMAVALTVCGLGTAAAQSSPMAFNAFSSDTMPLASAAQVLNAFTTHAAGGSGVVSLQRNELTISGAPNAYWWVGLDRLVYAGTGGTGQHVARYGQALRYGLSAGGAANNPQLWAGVFESDDMTGAPSSATNAQLSVELDLTGTNVDDAATRQMVTGVIAARDGGYFTAAGGYDLYVGPGAYVSRMAGWGGSIITAALDTRSVTEYARHSTTGAIPTLTADVSESVVVPVSNVIPFVNDRYGRDINAGHFETTVYFQDGSKADMVGYSITGTGPSPTGTITLTRPVSKPRGTKIYNASNVIWLASGQTVALSTDGLVQAYFDPATHRIVFSNDGTPIMSVDMNGNARFRGAVMPNTAP
jgi:hypothetical protein